MSDQTPPNSDELERRIAELENNVKEIGYVLNDLITELRDQECVTALPIPTCPPICPRS